MDGQLGDDIEKDSELVEKLARELEQKPRFFSSGKHLRYGSFFGPFQFDFRDANINALDFGITDKELSYVQRIVETGTTCQFKGDFNGVEVARKILQEETSFDLDNYDLYFGTNGAKGAIFKILSKVVSKTRPHIAYASPNWVAFDNLFDIVPDAQKKAFFANSAETYLRSFERIADDSVAAVLVVDPANPLGYRFNREQIGRLEQTCERFGIVPVFDDVFRGLQEKGKRHSASEYSHNAVVVESTSKRFGIRSLGATFTLVPKHLKLDDLEIDVGCSGCDSRAALTVDALYNCEYDVRVRNALVAATKAYARGLGNGLGGKSGNIKMGFLGMPLFTYHLPGELVLGEKLMGEVESFGVTVGPQWVCDFKNRLETGNTSQKELRHAFSYIRICPTKETPERCYLGGYVLGNLLAESFEKLQKKK